MTRIAAFAGLTLIIMASGAAYAEGDAEAGKTKAAVCAACHGADGNSTNPEWPSLAGQHEPYLVTQLEAFKNGERKDALMTPMSMALGDQDRADLAAFYKAQAANGGKVDPALVDAGQRVYRGGNTETAVSACAGCHGPNGHGNPGAGMPAIAGQHATYIAGQLRQYASGERSTDPDQMMRNTAASLSEAEIEAVASYVQGLR